MFKRKITIEFVSSAPDDVVDEIAETMYVQLESLNDGTLVMDGDEDPVNYRYTEAKYTVEVVPGHDEEESE
jgi:hypothetical protein